MNSRLKLDTNKLNPKFEGYKLAPLTDPNSICRVSLNDIQLYKPNNDQRLGFRDLQARIRYSHLIYGYPLDQHRGTSFCIDQEFNLHLIVYNKLTQETTFTLITQLIKPLVGYPGFTEPNRDVPIDPQPPSAMAISRELILASNGVGDIELIGIEEKHGRMLGTSLGSAAYMGTGTEGVSPVPCVLLTARQVKTKVLFVVYSKTKTNEFNIATLELAIPSSHTKRLDDGSFVLQLNTLHIQKGTEVPVYCAITPSGKQCILGSEVKYNPVHPVVDPDEPMEEVPKKPLYQWSQEGTDITVQFELPQNTPKSAISCKFLTDHLSLLVKDTAISFPYRKLWSAVQPDECTWTLEKDTLTLLITKKDERTRWPHLFDQDDGVLETLSPTQLSEINHRLAKFTSEEPLHPSQHPAATDMDEDIDDAGTPIVFSVYNNTSGLAIDEFNTGSYHWICSSYNYEDEMPSVCLQMDVDGLVFTLTETQDGLIQAEHTATMDAFAFVQASKRDARFIHHDSASSFASIVESSRNAYIYYHHDDKRLVEDQVLVDLTQGKHVDIVGATNILKNTLMVLTESQLVIVHL
ncbi:uncharacterized protein B0P05DRAFT_565367 [Gilbertella persicaria]|uniref:uncharacterized protein n=1 Tax=Gilbertella persicaria TaxID=101096 RepID=UPI0022202C83|nr:uncharacterized protein B0P05DRAFT_565367 [Gilbertella persicaria]KAI8047716.1 hypothetical protein B0P05DRAFT_565367 [Gilbertella persicaria]